MCAFACLLTAWHTLTRSHIRTLRHVVGLSVHASAMKSSFLGFVDCFMLLWLSTERSISYGTNNFSRVIFPRFLCKNRAYSFCLSGFLLLLLCHIIFLHRASSFCLFLCSSSPYSVFFGKLNGLLLCWVYDLHVLSLALALSPFRLLCVFLCECIYSMYERRCAVCVVKQCWNFNFVCNCFLFCFLFHRHCEWDDLNSVAEIGRMSFGNNNPHEVEWHEQFFLVWCYRDDGSFLFIHCLNVWSPIWMYVRLTGWMAGLPVNDFSIWFSDESGSSSSSISSSGSGSDTNKYKHPME